MDSYTMASVMLMLKLTPLSSMLDTTVSHLDPALVLTPSPRALMLQLRDMLLMVTLVTTMARETLKQILLFWLLDMAMLLSPTVLLPPLLATSTRPMSAFASTILVPLFHAKHLRKSLVEIEIKINLTHFWLNIKSKLI